MADTSHFAGAAGRPIRRLNALAVKRASKRGLLADGGGLYLSVGPTGAKSWIYRYGRDGRLRNVGLGSLLMVSLAKARLKAQACREQRGDEIDPLEAKRDDRQRRQLEIARSMTFEQCAAAYIKAHKAGWPRQTAWRPGKVR